jgi:sec-independent protein translocase protein TatC
LLVCIAAIAILFPVMFSISKPGIDWLVGTFSPSLTLYAFAMHEMFFLQMKMGFALAIAGAFPIIAWQVWRFVAPGLYEHERHYVGRFVFISSFLFLGGASFALFAVYPMVLRFFQSFGSDHIGNMWGIGNYVNMASMLMLGFGFMFQLPIVVYVIAVTELVSLDAMRKARPVVVVVLLIVSAVLTPPDVVSQIMMGAPAYILFEISLLVSERSVRKKVAARRKREEEERLREEEEERLAREEEERWRAEHPDEVKKEEMEEAADDEVADDYSEYYDEFYDESYNYVDQQEQPKSKPSKWKVRGLRRDRRFMQDALRKRKPRGRK